MKKEYSTPSISVLQIENSLPLMSSNPQLPSIGNGLDQEGSADQFSLDNNWTERWN